MRFSLAGACIALAAGLAVQPLPAQTTPPALPPTTPSPVSQPSQPQGKVIFSRSIDEAGQTTTESGPAAPPAPQMAPAPTADDAERQALIFTDFDIDAHLRPIDHHIAVRALLTVRNDSKSPLAHIPLQISSSLTWERIRVNLKDVAVPVATLNSDADHTGQLHEAAVPLAQPLAPGATLQLDVNYSGSIPANAQRLLTLGTPDDVALHSDWDEITPDFTGLRGFGNVVWYPVSSVPVILGDGARLFDEIGEHKLRLAGARFRLRLSVEFAPGQAPTVALVNGRPLALAVTQPGASNPGRAPEPQQPPTQEQTQPDPQDPLPEQVPGVATADSGGEILPFDAPSLFVAIRTAHPAANTTLWVLPAHEPAVSAWTAAAATVTPFLESWLGPRSRSQLTLLDLPDPQDAPYETGALLATALRAPSPEPGSAHPNSALSNPDQIEGILAHALTHAWMQSPRAWLSEGAAHFMGTLWIEKQRGRDQALESLEAARPALALAEPESPGQSPGQPLDQAISPVYYRTKATYVFWMLRSVAGDPTLAAAFREYQPQADRPHADQPHVDQAPAYANPARAAAPAASPIDPNATNAVNPGAVPAGARTPDPFERLLEQAGSRADLSWFFADWVDADKGLPDLSIGDVFPAPEQAGNWLVTVNIANAGYASAEVPVTVRSATSSVSQQVIVPARGNASPHLLIQGKPTEVQLNDGAVPEIQATIHIKKLESEPPE